jgi:hypothetical protein
MLVDDWKHEGLVCGKTAFALLSHQNNIRKRSEPHDGGHGLGMENDDQSYQSISERD